MHTFNFKKLSVEEAEQQFPGCITPEIHELEDENRVEPGYFKLGLLDGKLYSSTYEISWIGWSVWDPSSQEWRGLDDADEDLFMQLEDAEEIHWN